MRNTSVSIRSWTPMKGQRPSKLPFSTQAECFFRYETIMDLMSLQDQIDKFQKLIFSHFRSGANNETRISALVPLVQESYGIYKFATSMLRAMHASALFDTQHSAMCILTFLQVLAMMRPWSHCVHDTIPSTTVF